MTAPRVLIMAGGTGGHVFPALAVAHALRHRGVSVAWVGTARGIENDVVPAAGFTLHHLDVGGVRGKGPWSKLTAPARLAHAVWQAVRLMRRWRPDAVLGMGGFAAGPGGVAARMLRRPLVIHEQNAVAGTTNRWLARWADQVLTAYPGVLTERSDVRVVGNPVRADLTELPPPAERNTGHHDPLRLLVLGGSQGALALNRLLPRAIGRLAPEQQPEVRHQSGRAHLEVAEQAYSDAGIKASVVPFVDDMAEALAWADLVVARAGALTVAELAVVGVGSLLVPFPFAIDDHQTRNAALLVDAHAARVLPQSELTEDTLAASLTEALTTERLSSWAEAARRVAYPSATEAVVHALQRYWEAAR